MPIFFFFPFCCLPFPNLGFFPHPIRTITLLPSHALQLCSFLTGSCPPPLPLLFTPTYPPPNSAFIFSSRTCFSFHSFCAVTLVSLIIYLPTLSVMMTSPPCTYLLFFRMFEPKFSFCEPDCSPFSSLSFHCSECCELTFILPQSPYTRMPRVPSAPYFLSNFSPWHPMPITQRPL